MAEGMPRPGASQPTSSRPGQPPAATATTARDPGVPALAAVDPARQAVWRRVRRLLLVRLDNMGDVLMCTPAIQALRQHLPDAHLALLASPSGAALAPHLPQIDEVLTCTASWVKPGSAGAGGVPNDEAVLHTLRAGAFDAALIFTTATQSALPAALLCRLAGIPLRAAYSRENPYALLSDWLPEPDRVGPGMRHEVVRQMELIAALGLCPPATASVAVPPLQISVREGDRQRARAVLAGAGLAPHRPYVVVHPGATAASRRYPPDRFGAAMDVVVHAGWACVYCGAGSEAELVHAAREAMTEPSVDLCGQLDLGTLAAVLEDAELLVGNNSGPAHLAAAVGTPVVCLYALTNPQHMPWGVPSRVLFEDVPCRDCLRSVCPQGHHLCLQGVPAVHVAEAALSLLARQLRVPC